MQQQVVQHSLEQTPLASVNDAARGPVALSAELLELVSGGTSRGGADSTEGRQQRDDGVQSPRGGW